MKFFILMIKQLKNYSIDFGGPRSNSPSYGLQERQRLLPDIDINILRKDIKKYVIDNNKKFMYYEDFYQYIIDNFKKNEWVEELFEIAKNSLISDHQYLLEHKNKEFYKIIFRKINNFCVLNRYGIRRI